MKLFFSVALSIVCISASAQTKTKPVAAAKQENKTTVSDSNLEVYKRAISFGDYDAAKNALYQLMIKYPERLDYHDSLVTLYFSIGALPQCVLSGTEYLKKDTSNSGIMELVALANSQLKRYKEAIDLYEKMYMKSGNIYYAYQLAIHDYMLKRVGECNQMLDIILNDPKAETEKISISAEENKQQQVPLKAAALNLRGIIFQELNMSDKAKEFFDASLKVMPDFVLAKNNLDALNKKAEEKKETAPAQKTEEKKK